MAGLCVNPVVSVPLIEVALLMGCNDDGIDRGTDANHLANIHRSTLVARIDEERHVVGCVIFDDDFVSGAIGTIPGPCGSGASVLPAGCAVADASVFTGKGASDECESDEKCECGFNGVQHGCDVRFCGD